MKRRKLHSWRRKNYLLMLAISFLNSVHLFGAVSVPFFTELAKLTYAQMFIIQSIFTISWFALEIPTGVVAEKFGRKASMTAGFFFISIGTLITGLFTTFIGILTGEIIIGLGGALVSGANTSLFYESVEIVEEDTRKGMMRNYQLSSIAGKAVGFLIGPYIASLNYPHSLAWTFIGNSFLYGLTTLLTMFLRETGKAFQENYMETAIKGVKEVLTKAPILALDYSLVSSLLFMIYWIYQPLLLAKGMRIEFLGYVAIAMNLLSIPALKLLKIKKYGNMLALSLTASLLFAILPYVNALETAIIAVAISAVFAIRKPFLLDEINKTIRERRAVANSTLSMLFNMSRAVIYPVIGMVMDKSIELSLFSISAISALLIASIFLLSMGKPKI